MTKFERKLFFRSSLVGIGLTIITVLLDQIGFLKRLEFFLDDARASFWQFFMPPPTTQLVHVDLDDGTLDAVGAWPWPRQRLALVLEEMYKAGAKVVDFDVILPEAQDVSYRPDAPPIDNDQLFAGVMEEFRSLPGRGVLMPMSINLDESGERDPLYQAEFQIYLSDLEVEQTDVVARLKAKGFTRADLAERVGEYSRTALEQALFERMRVEIDKGRSPDAQTMRSLLLPQSDQSGKITDAVLKLRNVLPRVQAYESLVRFTRAPEQGLPPLLSRDREQALPIAKLAAAAGYTGFVDFWRADNNKVRDIPLWVLDRGRMVPQMGLALACAELGVSTNDLILKADSVTIPCPDGHKIVIPVHTHTAGGETSGMLMDIPWFGGSNWKTMYDTAAHTHDTQHMPMTRIWDICIIQSEIEENNRKAVDALKNVASKASTDDFYRVRDHAPPFSDPAAWNKLISNILDDLAPGIVDNEDYKAFLDGKASIDTVKDPQERELALDLHKVLYTLKGNDELVSQRAELRQKLHDQLSGKAVLIGWIATGLIDEIATPLHLTCPGVVVHGVIYNAIMTGNFLRRAPGWTAFVLTVLMGLLVTFVSNYFQGLNALFVTLGIVIVYTLLNCLVGYDWQRIEIDSAGPMLAAMLIWPGCTLYHYLSERTERTKITNRFSSYVDPSLVNYVLEHPDVESFDGERRELTVVFTDLAGFTQLSEMLKEETVPLLNEYLGLMVPIIGRHHGFTNKFLGDGIMFFFGAPEPYPGDDSLHAWAAVQAIMEMQDAMISFNAEMVRRNLPQLYMRAGVSTGEMTVGDAGNPPARSDYTVLGDRVNFASRLESANKFTGTRILISDRTVELLRGTYLVRPIGRLQVVGKHEPVMTYEPIAPIEKATQEMHRLVEMTKTVTDAFVGGRFAQCAAAARKLEEEFGMTTQGKFCELYLRHCAEYLETPPVEFLGQIKLEAK